MGMSYQEIHARYLAGERRAYVKFRATVGQSSAKRLTAAFKATGGRIMGAEYDLIMKLGLSAQSGKGLTKWTDQELHESRAGLQAGLDGPLTIFIEVIDEELGKRRAAPTPLSIAPEPVPPKLFLAEFMTLTPHTGSKPFHCCVSFTKPLSTGYAEVRDHGFSVTGGRVTGARRVDGRSDLWDLTVRPDSKSALTVTTTNSLQSRNFEPLSSPASVTFVPAQVTSPPSKPSTKARQPAAVLTGRFVNPLLEHTGHSFRVRVEFSKPLSTGYATVRDQGFRVTGGRVTGARRVDKRSDLWELTVEPTKQTRISIVSTDVLRTRAGLTLNAALKLTLSYVGLR